MGKGTIITNHGEGDYTVRLDFDTSRVVNERTRLYADVAGVLQDTIDNADTALTDAETAFTTADSALNQAILQNDPEDEIKALFVQKQSANIVLNNAQKDLIRAKSNKLTAEKRIDYINKHLPVDPEIRIRSADYNANMVPGTVVGTVEVPGERQDNLKVLIKPRDWNTLKADWNVDDGVLQPYISCTPETFFLGKAYAVGQYKWNPQYRLGIITSFNDDALTCTVALESATIEATPRVWYNVNAWEVLYNVPFSYQDWDIYSFDESAEVLIEFTDRDWDKPVIVGFKADPVNEIEVTGFLLEQSGIKHRVYLEDDEWKIEENVLYVAGASYWTDSTRSLSWDGPSKGFYGGGPRSTNIYSGGRLLAIAPDIVVGAGFVDDVLIVACSNGYFYRQLTKTEFITIGYKHYSSEYQWVFGNDNRAYNVFGLTPYIATIDETVTFEVDSDVEEDTTYYQIIDPDYPNRDTIFQAFSKSYLTIPGRFGFIRHDTYYREYIEWNNAITGEYFSEHVSGYGTNIYKYDHVVNTGTNDLEWDNIQFVRCETLGYGTFLQSIYNSQNREPPVEVTRIVNLGPNETNTSGSGPNRYISPHPKTGAKGLTDVYKYVETDIPVVAYDGIYGITSYVKNGFNVNRITRYSTVVKELSDFSLTGQFSVKLI